MTNTLENLKIEAMAKAGVHYGYSKTRRHPSTKPFIQSTQNGVDLIDLNKSKEQLTNAITFLKSVADQGKSILFICEKVELASISREIALSLNYPYVSNRFIGGAITNFPQIKKRIEKLHTMLKDKEEGK
jgi:small subunit ribosomal protein S2